MSQATLAALLAEKWAHEDSLRTNTRAEILAALAKEYSAPNPVPVPTTPVRPVAAVKRRLLVPAYLYPSDNARAGMWTRLAALGKRAVVIVNPRDGDFAKADGDYTKAIAQLDAGGVDWIGYVHLKQGTRSTAAILDDIANWKRFYPSAGGIFLDDQPKAFMKDFPAIVAACRAAFPGKPVFSNPGLTGCDPKYLSHADVLVMSEHAGPPSTLPEWAEHAADERIAFIAHNVKTEADMLRVVAQSNGHFGYVWVTDRIFGRDLFGGLPSYFDRLLAAVTG